MLAPSVNPAPGGAHAFGMASLSRYPGFVAALEARTGLTIPMSRWGIIELPSSADEAIRLRIGLEPPASWLDTEELGREEPGLAAPFGGAFHPANGSVEPLPLMDALRSAVASHDRVQVTREDCCELYASDTGCNVLTDLEGRYASDHVVLAAGAWTPLIVGAGSAVAAVQPLRGQMIAFSAAPVRPVRRVVCGGSGYLIPRSDGLTVAGGTMEHAGFEATTTPEGIEQIRLRAIELCPSLARAPIHSSWAGLRPATPDLLPIIGPDPDRARVILAVGHSRNGILLAPLTAEVVADLVTGAVPRHDISEFVPRGH